MSPEPGSLPRPRKRFGQHFLHDAGVIGRIVECIGTQPGEVLCEIGPGRGALTDRLAESGNVLHLLEIDRDLAGLLRERYTEQTQVTVHERDALNADLRSFSPNRPLVVVGNLPYNIASVLLIRLLSQRLFISRMVFMLQKEVAQRLVAEPGSSGYSRLSVMVNRVCETRLLFDVGPGAFSPPPKVRSAVVSLRPRAEPLGPSVPDKAFEALVRQAFSQRRKTLRNALKGACQAEVIAQAGIDPDARPQTLAVQDFARLVSQQLADSGG